MYIKRDVILLVLLFPVIVHRVVWSAALKFLNHLWFAYIFCSLNFNKVASFPGSPGISTWWRVRIQVLAVLCLCPVWPLRRVTKHYSFQNPQSLSTRTSWFTSLCAQSLVGQEGKTKFYIIMHRPGGLLTGRTYVRITDPPLNRLSDAWFPSILRFGIVTCANSVLFTTITRLATWIPWFPWRPSTIYCLWLSWKDERGSWEDVCLQGWKQHKWIMHQR